MRRVLLAVLVCLASASSAVTGDRPSETVEVLPEDRHGRVLLRVAGQPMATYTYRDAEIPRPYFAHVRASGGIPVTRSHPPVPGVDAVDHGTFHPGLWMAFGDLSGADSWRLKAPVSHDGFEGRPRSGRGEGSFAVRSRYLSEHGDRVIARETCRFTLRVRPAGTLLLWDSTFTPGDRELVFGDQEEMGLGIRVSTPLTVTRGGRILDSEGRINEGQVRGKIARWWDYSGPVGGRRAGLTVMPDPRNFRASWSHARDYGFLAANPFGRRALTGGEPSRVTVAPGEHLRLRYGILVHSAPADRPIDLTAAYEDYLRLSR